MDNRRDAALAKVEQRLGYTFQDRTLLDTALTHTSFVKGDGKNASHNERLEFLGDAVLELCVSEYLYCNFPQWNEGKMTRARAAAVCETALDHAARRLGLQCALRLGRGEEFTGGREKPSIVSDALEALIGAIFLDGGIAAAKPFILEIVKEPLEEVAKGQTGQDYKTALQEYVQKRHLGKLEYSLLDAVGPDHKKQFRMEVRLEKTSIGQGKGGSKQEAGQRAAKAALAAMKAGEKEGSEQDNALDKIGDQRV